MAELFPQSRNESSRFAQAPLASAPDREPFRFAARKQTLRCSKDRELPDPSGLLRTGTVRGPGEALPLCAFNDASVV